MIRIAKTETGYVLISEDETVVVFMGRGDLDRVVEFALSERAKAEEPKDPEFIQGDA